VLFKQKKIKILLSETDFFLFVKSRSGILAWEEGGKEFSSSRLPSFADPGSGAFLPPESGMEQWSDPGSGISKQNLLISFIEK
jgi:hypothetical protein